MLPSRSRKWRNGPRRATKAEKELSAAFDCSDRIRQGTFIHPNQVARTRKTPALHILGVFPECGDPLVLQAPVLLQEIPIRLRMAGNPIVIISQNIIRKKK